MKRTILLIDDAENWYDTVAFILQEEGFDVLWARSRTEARTIIASRRQIDVALVNLNLKPDSPILDGTGYLLLEEFGRDWPQVPRIAVSAFDECDNGKVVGDKVVDLYNRYKVRHVAIKGGQDFAARLVHAIHEAIKREDMKQFGGNDSPLDQKPEGDFAGKVLPDGHVESSAETQNGTIVIVTSTRVEIQALLEVFSAETNKAWNRQVIGKKTYYNLGFLGEAPVFVVQSEMGTATPGGALLTIRQAIQDLQPQAVIMCGIAFGLRPDKQQLGDILVAKQLLHYEPQKVDLQRGIMPRGDRTTSAERLLDRFRSGDNDWQGAPTHFGLVLSGEKLINDPDVRNWLLNAEPEAIGGEMEGAGLYAAARDAKVDWILVKAICDWADGEKDDSAQKLAARNAARFVLHVLRLGGWSDSVPHLERLAAPVARVEKSEELMSAVDYVDFHLHIAPTGHARARSEQGERTATISLEVPTDVDLTAEMVEHVKPSEELLRKLGIRLFEIIFPAQIDKHFNVTEASARKEGKKIRIRLTIEPDALAQLPWEFLYRSEGGYFLATNPDTVLSHYLDLPLPQNYAIGREGPLHILTIISNPSDQPQLNVSRWKAIVHEALSEPIRQGILVLDTVKQATFEKIRDALLVQPPDIVQFIGHGVYHDGKGYLALVDSNAGKTWEVDDVRFAAIFAGVQDRLGLVSLATCESAKSDSPKSFLGIAPRIVQRGTPAVVAMRYPVLVETAEIFVENFYKALAARYPVDWAVQSARNAIAIKMGLHNREFATPVLFMRAKDGNIF